jgi:hypothetical protein
MTPGRNAKMSQHRRGSGQFPFKTWATVFTALCLLASLVGCSSDGPPLLPGWHQINVDGFGDPMEGALFLGTAGVDSGCEVWRTY